PGTEPGAGAGPGPDAALPMGPDVAGHGPAGAGPGHQGLQDGVPSWPALPPSFGQRSTAGERPAVAPPAPGSGYGGFRPLGSLPPGGPPPGSPSPRGPGARAGPGPPPRARPRAG